MENFYDRSKKSSEYLANKHEAPEYAVILGSGLADVIPNIDVMRCIPFSEIPGFNVPTVLGHKGEIRLNEIKTLKGHNRKIAFVRGRNHAYEGHNVGEVVHNVRSLIMWGVKNIILTNAAGCLHTDWQLGKAMVISDHINMTGLNPNIGQFGEYQRFIDMTNSYDKEMVKTILDTGVELKQMIYSGVYCGVLGPSFETPAEIRMMKTLGADTVGMSTVLETIAARQLGAKVAGISCITNYAAGLTLSSLSHHEVLETGKNAAHDMANLLIKALERF